ncbi:MAG: hypothetical protein O7C75_10995 [Verrucomicrobia bacterium]|nr:hypothetical protein [Verrucomicrobiota bacterium]
MNGNLADLKAEELVKDPVTGLIKAKNWELVRTHCMVCHSTKGFTQIRLDRKNWQKIIQTMQAQHGLWQLGEAEVKVLDYLEGNYGLPKEAYNPKIRRPL